jgi:2-methylisocitrate lyase-like PEP mutase family enzyme
MTFSKILRQLIQTQQTVVTPGVFDGLSALLAKQAGFPVLYASGGAIARAAGYPDLGLLTLTEITQTITQIIAVTQLPVIADADTGFGNVLNVKRTVEAFERIGVAGLHIEDQTFPKRCGHLNDKSLISTEEMCEKIAVARASLTDPNIVLIARTDAIAVEGLQSAIARALAYQKAGADMLFIEAPETIAQIEEIAATVPGLKLINMFHGGKTPMVPVERLQALGYHVIIIPSDLQRAAIKAMQQTLATIYQHGNSALMTEQLTSFAERETIIGTANYLTIGQIKK